MSYDNRNKGVLFKNDRKKTDKHPDYTGSININGTDHWLSAWINEKNGSKYMSLSIGDAKETQSPARVGQKAPKDQTHDEWVAGYDGTKDTGTQPDFDDDIPF